ncbi:protein FAM234A isoform X2 [Brachionichthys hirsutus]|uniref:protein FAM234A isoform X2 n=1 Tax=Brachionichthys hirsutus TaxID=412623 RepID=UPI0036044FC9
METSGNLAEGDPLKREEDGAEAGITPTGTKLRKKSFKETLGFANLTHWRTAIFFFSLFLCLTVVFAFSFVIPCPVRPQYLASWERNFSDAATYDFLAIEDTSRDKVNDVLFVLKTQGNQNNTCSAAGLPSPCVFVFAVDGTDGTTVWERPLAPEYHWAQCGLEEGTSRSWDCLLSHSNQLTAIDKYTGDVRWQQPQPPGLHRTLPALSVPDLDKDKVSDLALVASNNTQIQLIFISGKTGSQIGSTVVLDSIESTIHLLHRTPGGSHYVLLQNDTGLYGRALWRIAAEANPGMEADLKKDKHWENKASPTSGYVPIYESDSMRYVRSIGRTDKSPNLLVVTETEAASVDGKTSQLLWRFNTSAVLREPSFGHFNKDDVLDVVLEEDIGSYRKRVIILDGKSGGVLWEVELMDAPNSPRPDAVHTINSFSIFVFWGSMPSKNSTVPMISDRCSYMLHPLYPNILLESPSSLDHIVTFTATLMEHGRHAAFILLTGPETEGAEGTVVLGKRKLKQDVPDSNVRPIGTSGTSETNEDIKAIFNRLRFSDW